MVYRDLREFLTKLEKEGQLVHIHDQILPEPDIRNIGRAASNLQNGPAVMMDNIKGYKGKRVVLNAHGSWANHAIMLGMKKDATIKEQFYNLDEKWDKYPGETRYVDKPSCQEVVIKDNINIAETIPIFRINSGDGGCFFSKASVITKDPDEPDNEDTQNVGTYRIQVQGKDVISIQCLPFHDMARQLVKAEERNEALPVAIALGVDPVLTFMASTPLKYNESEYKYAAAINGIPMDLCKGVVCKNLDIPANAEYVIEGEFIPRERFPEGPFGEFPGSYSGIRKQTRIKVKAITHRVNPIFENLYLGRPWTECDFLIALNTSVPLYKQLRETMPEVVSVNAMYQHGLSLIISTKNRFGGYAKNVAFRAASTPHGISYCKNIFLVGEDVDPFNFEEVMWSLSTRVRPDKDVIVIPNVPGMPLDPTSEPPGMGCKFIVDATPVTAPDKLLRDTKLVDKMEGKAKVYEKIIADLQKAAGK